LELDRLFLDALRAGRITHAYLVTGAGAAELCQKAAALLLCEGTGEQKPCGGCKACKEHAAGANPDFLRVLPAEGKKQISVESVRAMEQQLAGAQIHRAYRPVWIPEAHRMNEKAQSALLKTLEEPPRGTVFLLSGNENGLLPTILSRCVVLRLRGQEQEVDPVPGEKLLAAAERGRLSREVFPKDKEELAALLASVSAACELRLKRGDAPAPLLQALEWMDRAEYRLDANANQNLLVDCLIAEFARIFAKRAKS